MADPDAGAVFEIRTELDEGWKLHERTERGRTVVEEWRGIRVRYRLAGSRGRWSSFLLECDELPSKDELAFVVKAHAERRAGARS